MIRVKERIYMAGSRYWLKRGKRKAAAKRFRPSCQYMKNSKNSCTFIISVLLRVQIYKFSFILFIASSVVNTEPNIISKDIKVFF